jgi:membrane protein implicated in regulation of membrane protease activity
MSAYVIWWIVAFALVAAELTTGTFYLLVYGIAAAAAGIAAWLGLGTVAQLVIAAVIGIAGTLVLKKWKRAEATDADLQDLDIGKSVAVESWQGSKGQVKYRGAVWDAEAAGGEVDPAKPLYIRAMRGSLLIVGN